MRVISKRTILLDEPIPVYDVVNAAPYHNFLIEDNGNYMCSHNCGLMDEVDFVKNPNPDMNQSKVMKIYRSIKRRMESRFMRNGTLPGMLFLISSKKSEHDFLEQYTATQLNNPYVFIVDQPLWKVKPASNYSGKMFKVAVGNKFVKSTIIREDEDLESYDKQGYQVLDVPVEHYEAFNLDIDSALMDIAGISTTSKSKFISYERLKRNYTTRRNPFTSDVLTIGLDDDMEIRDFFIPELVDDNVKTMPGFIHIDTSLTGDRTGIGYVAISGTKLVNKYIKSDEVKIEKQVDLVYRQVFTVGIKSPSDSEISLEKTRQFIYYLRSEGYNIKGISTDGFQSADTLQLLKVAGYKSKLASLDRSPNGYLTFKSAINEERIELLRLDDSLLETELTEVERDGVSGKIDHPPTGSKDLADGLTGALWGASQYELSEQMRHAEEDVILTSELMNSPEDSMELATKHILGMDMETRVLNDFSDVFSSGGDDILDW